MSAGLRFWSCVLLLAGCDRVFQLDELPDAPARDSASTSADAGPEVPPDFCASPQVLDDFSSDLLPFCPWGTSYGQSITQHDSVLDIKLPGTAAAMTGCTSTTPHDFTEGGVILHVQQANDVDNSYTTLTIRGAGAVSFDAAVAYKGGSLRFGSSTGGYAEVVGPNIAWWRMRTINGRLEALVSEDGVVWTPIGMVAVTPSPQVYVDIGTGLDVAPTIPGGEAQLSLFAICN